MAIQSSHSASPTGVESASETESDAVGIPLDTVYGLLSNERRRQVLQYLVTESETETTTLGSLAEHIAVIENDKPEEALSSEERKRVYICLYQCHLPTMDDAGVIDFDAGRKTIELGENAEYVMQYLPEAFADRQTGESGEWMSPFVNAVQAVGSRLPNIR